MTAFHVGQKVVCIGDDWRETEYPDVLMPIKGSIYTVRDIEIIPDDDAYLRFEELRNPVHRYQLGNCETSFEGSAFRPLVERKTSIAIFHEILKTQRVRTPA